MLSLLSTIFAYLAVATCLVGAVSPSTTLHDHRARAAAAAVNWTSALTKASAAVSRLNLADKVKLATGLGWQAGPCIGNTASIPSVSFPGLCLDDSPVGVRNADLVSVFPAGISIAATFNRKLMNARGVAMGQEFKGKGVHVALGPAMNLQRAPAAGRNWEGFGADPYLSGEAAFETIQGMQSAGVQACAKHYINNEQEHFRDTSSSNVADRVQHELYLHPFLKSVQAGVASVMCSYNQINGTYSCSNAATIRLLKNELGFKGYLMTDWWGAHSTQDANAGLDMTMPGDITIERPGSSYFGQSLVSAVNGGQVAQSRIDDMATRILAAWYLLGQDSGYPAVNFDAWNPSRGRHVNVQADHASLIRQIGAASAVLLKNTNSALPLKQAKTIALIGSAAGPNPQGVNSCADRGCNKGTLGTGWGSGTAEFPYLTTPVSAFTTRSQRLGASVTSSTTDTDLNAAENAARGKDVAIVFITANSGEGYITVEGHVGDRNDLNAWHGGDALVTRVARSNANTVVVINSVGPVITEAWITNPNVTAVLWNGLPGQEGGQGVTDVIFGDVNPSGRLPFTMGKSMSDYSASVVYSGGGNVQISYNEGLKIDYFGFDTAGTAPRFEFGFGLSYTNFTYRDVAVQGSVAGGSPPSGPGASLDPWLHDPVVTVSFTLENSGTVAGTEIPQLYLTLPAATASPPKKLKGFESVNLAPGASTPVRMSLSRYDLSVWNSQQQGWALATGNTTISIGASSRDIRLTTSVVI